MDPSVSNPICVCICVRESHCDLGGVVQNADPFHQILLVVGLQVELPHARVYNCGEIKKKKDNM